MGKALLANSPSVHSPNRSGARASLLRRFRGFVARLISGTTDPSQQQSSGASVAPSTRRDHLDSRKLESFKQSVLGNDKPSLADVLGNPPRVAEIRSARPGQITHPPCLLADVRYYPLDEHQRIIAVVRFSNGIASEVQFVRAPSGQNASDVSLKMNLG